MAEPTQEATPQQVAANAQQALAAEYDIRDDEPSSVDGPGRNEPAVTATAPPAPPHPAWLVDQARDLGFTDAEVGEMTTDELGRSVRWAIRQERTQRQAPPPPPKPQPPEEEPIDLGIPEDMVAPEIVTALKKIERNRRKETAELREKLEKAEQANQQRQQLDETQQIDAGFAALEQDFGHVFGKGSIAEIDARDNAAIMRNAVVASLRINWPKGARTWGQAVAQRARELFGAQSSSPEPEHPPGPATPLPRQQQAAQRPRDPQNGRFTQEQWNGGALQRPTQRRGAQEPPGRQKAERAVAERMRELDAQQGDVQDDGFFDSFPE